MNHREPSDDWYSGPVSEEVWGDSGPWVRHLALAWQAVADPLGPHPTPAAPPQPFDLADSRQHGQVIAWWSPLFHLTFFGLGWLRPDVGLARWLEAGRPADGPVLRVLDRWWGETVADFIAWTHDSFVFHNLCQAVATSQGTTVPSSPMRDVYGDRRRDPRWGPIWGGGSDSMHIAYHIAVACGTPDEALVPGSVFHEAKPSRTSILLLPRYIGWYRALAVHGATLPKRSDGRSWQVKVIVEPLGVLGTFRRSRTTGRWFSGRHRHHELGIGPADGDAAS